MKKNVDMTVGAPFKLILIFTLPIICNYVLQQFYTMADSAIVAAALGDDAVTGVNLTGSLNFLVLGFANGCTAGFGVSMAQFVGAKDEGKMRKSLFTSVCLTVLISLILMVGMVACSRQLLILLETNPLYLDYSDSYAKALFSGVLFTMFYNLSSQFLLAMGDSRSPVYILLVCTVLNIGLNSLLFVFDLGVAWAGWATVISQGVAAVVGFFVLFKKFPVLRLSKTDLSFSARFAGRHLAISLPMALQYSVTAIGCMIQQRAFNLFPPEYAKGQTTGGRIVGIVENGIFNAFGAAVATYYGQNYGAKRVDRLRQGVYATMEVGGILLVAATGFVYLLFPIMLPILLPSYTQKVRALAFTYIAINSSMYLFLVMIHIFRNALQGTGKSGVATLGGVIELGARALCAFTLAKVSFKWACFSNPMAWISAGIFFAIVFLNHLKKMERKAAKRMYKNPLMEGADPFVLLHKNKYYLYATNAAEEGFRVFVSDDLSAWEDKGFCLKKGDVIGNGGFWAPEVMERDGKFYMVYVADEHLAVATADSPLGPFTQTEKKWLSERNAIDGHFFVDDDGTVYLYYVRFDCGNVLYMTKMNADLKSFDEENERFLLRAEEEWELKDCSVLEGAFVLKRGDRYLLTYSANHTRSPDYAIGYAVSDSPYGPFVRYSGNPILHKNENVNGVGHHSFTTSKDGKELICVYHCHYSKTQFQPRQICIDRAEFIKDGNGDEVLVVCGPTVEEQEGF